MKTRALNSYGYANTIWLWYVVSTCYAIYKLNMQ